MAEWLYEAGIGEARAALIEGGRIIEACIEPDGDGPRPGAVLAARLRANRIAELESGQEALLDRTPKGVTEGSTIRVMLTREALGEPGKPKRALARVVEPTTPLSDGATLLERITAIGLVVRILEPHDVEDLEQAGWCEALESAASGEVPFPGGALRISLTPAMTLIDVDGGLDPTALAVAGATAAGETIRRFGIAGSIGIDLPTVGDKGVRVVAADALRAALPLPFEATAVNGFGFMQIVRPRARASLCELLTMDRAGAAARALLRRAERSGLVGAIVISAHPAVAAIIAARPDWTDRLARHLGGTVRLRSDPALVMEGGHVAKDQG